MRWVERLQWRHWLWLQRLELWGYWPPRKLVKSLCADIRDRWEAAPMQILMCMLIGLAIGTLIALPIRALRFLLA